LTLWAVVVVAWYVITLALSGREAEARETTAAVAREAPTAWGSGPPIR
jgi:hypothetical protein